MHSDTKWLRDMAVWWRDFAHLGPLSERQNRLDIARGFDELADKAEQMNEP